MTLRIVLPNIPLHIIQRGNISQACFYAEQDYQLYLEWLAKYAEETGLLDHRFDVGQGAEGDQRHLLCIEAPGKALEELSIPGLPALIALTGERSMRGTPRVVAGSPGFTGIGRVCIVADLYDPSLCGAAT
jgi:putative transposase